MSACDKKQEAAAEAKVKEVSAETKVKAEGAIEKMKAAGAQAAEKTKEVSGDVLTRGREMAGKAVKVTRELGEGSADYAKEKLGIPETDGLLTGLKGMFDEADEAIKAGKFKEKTEELKAKWNTLYARLEANAASLAPAQKARVKAFLSDVQQRWDALFGPKFSQ